MDSFDHSNTIVLLIGSSEFPLDSSIQNIPNVEVNIRSFKSCLEDPFLIGIPPSNIFISINEDRTSIERRLRDIAEKTRNRKYTLLIYYSGHAIFSNQDYQLYLSTPFSTIKDLEIDSLSLDVFKKYIKRSTAGKKLIIMDCCHSGTIINSMNDLESSLQSEFQSFDGTYIITSSAQEAASLFPVSDPGKPTYFTHQLITTISSGLDPNQEYGSLRDVFHYIDQEFIKQNLPRPQQFNHNRTDKFYFFKNKNFIDVKKREEQEWTKALQSNTIWAFIDYRKNFPNGKYDSEAKTKIYDLEAEAEWQLAIKLNTIFSFYTYLEKFPDSIHYAEAQIKLEALRSVHQNESSGPKEKKIGLALLVSFFKKINGYRFTVATLVIIILINNLVWYLSQKRADPTTITNPQLSATSSLKDADTLFNQNELKKALPIYKANIEWLSPHQTYNLSEIYEYGVNGFDPAKAFFWTKRAAEMGDPDAMVKLATKYKTGVPGICDIRKDSTFYWYFEAADRGHIAAALYVSQLYQKGEGIGRNQQKARYWFDIWQAGIRK